MASNSVGTLNGEELIVQGFRPGKDIAEPYVYLGVVHSDGTLGGHMLSIENAKILGVYLQRNVEFALTVREQGE